MDITQITLRRQGPMKSSNDQMLCETLIHFSSRIHTAGPDAVITQAVPMRKPEKGVSGYGETIGRDYPFSFHAIPA